MVHYMHNFFDINVGLQHYLTNNDDLGFCNVQISENSEPEKGSLHDDAGLCT